MLDMVNFDVLAERGQLYTHVLQDTAMVKLLDKPFLYLHESPTALT